MKSYGHLTVICGPMFSGKTTELLKRILWAKNGQHRTIRVYKAAFDVRYKKFSLVSHEGLSAPAEAISDWYGIDENIEAVFFDEVQFFDEPHYMGKNIVTVIKSLLESNIDVVASGLDMDWQGKPFNIVAQLMAMAEDVYKIRGICAVCGRPSTRSYKKTQSGESVELGTTDLYEPRCTHHWASPDDESQLTFNFDTDNPKEIITN